MDAKNCRNLFLIFNSVDERCWLNQNIAFMTFKVLSESIYKVAVAFDMNYLSSGCQ